MSSSLPNINLRVFRRTNTDMSLLYNCSELARLLNNNLVKPKVFINGNELQTIVQKAQAKDATSTDICIFIDYSINKLNSDDKYEVELRFPINEINFIQYYIIVEGAGLIPSLKDNKQMFTQNFAYNSKKKRWVKPTAVEDENGDNKILVSDPEVVMLLKEILKKLK
jgi:hypothetical protein